MTSRTTIHGLAVDNAFKRFLDEVTPDEFATEPDDD